jgi:hypothetical protein
MAFFENCGLAKHSEEELSSICFSENKLFFLQISYFLKIFIQESFVNTIGNDIFVNSVNI